MPINFEKPTNEEASILILEDIITAIKKGEKPRFLLLLLEENPNACGCGNKDCLKGVSTLISRHNLSKIAAFQVVKLFIDDLIEGR